MAVVALGGKAARGGAVAPVLKKTTHFQGLPQMCFHETELTRRDAGDSCRWFVLFLVWMDHQTKQNQNESRRHERKEKKRNVGVSLRVVCQILSGWSPLDAGYIFPVRRFYFGPKKNSSSYPGDSGRTHGSHRSTFSAIRVPHTRMRYSGHPDLRAFGS